MAVLHVGTTTTLAAVPIADCSNNDVAYIWLNSVQIKMVFDSTATNETAIAENLLTPYYIRPTDYGAGPGVWVEDVGALEEERLSANQIITGRLRSTNCTTATGSEYDLDNATIKLGGTQVDAAGSYLGAFLGLDSGTYKFYVGDGTNKYFKFDGTNISWKGVNTELTTAGLFSASRIVATGGTIGGFTLAATTFTATNLILDSANQEIKLGSGNDIVSLDAADGTYRLAIGHATYAIAPFRVTKAGVLYAAGANITGNIYASTGTIANWAIATNYLTSTNIGLHSASAASGAQILIGHATSYASAKIGLKNDGSGKLADGNFTWNAAGLITSVINSGGGITVKDGADITLEAGGDLVLVGHDTTGDKAEIVFDSNIKMGASTGFLGAGIWTDTTANSVFAIGLEPITAFGSFSNKFFQNVFIRAEQNIDLQAIESAGNDECEFDLSSSAAQSTIVSHVRSDTADWESYYKMLASPADAYHLWQVADGDGSLDNALKIKSDRTVVVYTQMGIGTDVPTSALQVVGLPTYASNASAVAGGLTAGAFYRTNADPDPVCVVH